MITTEKLQGLARLTRQYVLSSTTAAGSGHPTSCLSAADLMVCLMFGGTFRADLKHPAQRTNDRIIFSKGHAAPLLYALYAVAGVLPFSALKKLRTFGNMLEGHPMPSFRYTEVPTGSLGQGLSVGLGEALAARMDHLSYRVFVLLGDSEMSEGSVWEALMLAGTYKLGNLIAILDMNRLGQSGPTMLGDDAATYSRRIKSFGWNTIIVNGHSYSDIIRAFLKATSATGRPTMIIARTVKGKGVSFLEDKEGWHGRSLTKDELKRALNELGPANNRPRGDVAPSGPRAIVRTQKSRPVPKLRYRSHDLVSPREAVGRALVRIARSFPSLVVLDAEVKNSTYTELFEKRYPRSFVQTYIAEQNMAGVALGLARRGKIPVAATFAAFWTRAFDQIRMSQYARSHIVYVGTHPGVHIGNDGASQMGLEDIALFRALNRCTILYPSDAVSSERLVEAACRTDGLVYVRATRARLPILYPITKRFTVGGSVVLHRTKHDVATVVAAGVTVHEALKAWSYFAARKIPIRIIDCYSIQPLDSGTLRTAVQETGHIIVVEDHRQGGGIAEAIRSSLGRSAGAVSSLSVRTIPRSGSPEELLAFEHIDSAAIIAAVRAAVNKKRSK